MSGLLQGKNCNNAPRSIAYMIWDSRDGGDRGEESWMCAYSQPKALYNMK